MSTAALIDELRYRDAHLLDAQLMTVRKPLTDSITLIYCGLYAASRRLARRIARKETDDNLNQRISPLST